MRISRKNLEAPTCPMTPSHNVPEASRLLSFNSRQTHTSSKGKTPADGKIPARVSKLARLEVDHPEVEWRYTL